MDESDAAASNDPAESNPDPALISSSPPEAVVPKAPIKPIDYVSRFFEAGQSNAIEQLVALKDELRDADTESFWTRLMEGLTTICHAQCAFVAKESHKDDDDDDDDEDTDVEMLSLDERSSSLLGVAVYYNDGKGFQAMHRDYRYLSWDIPCTSMNHDKVCLVPESLPAVIGKDADRLPFPVEAYLAVPLFSAGRCFAHVGMLWTAEGLLSRDVSWPYLEMILHSLEDLILQHIAVDEGHRKPPHLQRWEELDRRLLQGKPTKTVVNQSNPMAAPAFKPYARSLSHELRTPMQGVVGMLDIMHATVQEKLENKLDPSLVPMFTEFRENIEAVQDAMDDALLDAVARRPSTTRESQSSRPLRAVFPPMVLHYTKVRDLLRLVINESLQVGGRPDSARVESTDCGERIEVQTLGCNGQASTKYIDWWVDPSVPESLCVDEKDLTKLVSCVFLNALKFTEVGEITVAVTVGGKPPCVLINVKDTGTGIPEAFLPKLFKPWAREDGSTTRSKEGLGLGLMVAKGLSRKLGGDLVCVRSSTTEPNRGSEFQIRLPLFPSDSVSRPPTPYTNSSTPRSTAPSVGTDGAHSPPTDQPKPKINGEVSSPLASPTLPDTKDPGQQNGVHQSQMIRRLSGNSKPIPLMRHTCDKTLAKRHPLTFLVAEDNKINRRILVNMLAKLGYSDVYEAFDGKEAVRIVSEILSSQASSPPPSTPSAPISTRSRSNSDITLPNTPVNQPPSNHSTLAMDPANPTQTQSPPDSDQEADKTLPSTKDYKAIDLVLMDLWMPDMDGYEATEKIFALVEEYRERLANIDLNADGHGQTSQPVSLGPPTVFAVSADVTDEALDRANRVGMAGYMTKPYKLRDLERLIEEFCSARER
uniref:histidine kinase n=1 Tax=Coccidioides posadasii RMSCC 3488 TaxID=454284 RepID=A0A0J6FSX6_COCPO|nr:hypothetical protein CPAG_08463 [Coccidioides posadasii RMSCC 3488]